MPKSSGDRDKARRDGGVLLVSKWQNYSRNRVWWSGSTVLLLSPPRTTLKCCFCRLGLLLVLSHSDTGIPFGKGKKKSEEEGEGEEEKRGRGTQLPKPALKGTYTHGSLFYASQTNPGTIVTCYKPTTFCLSCSVLDRLEGRCLQTFSTSVVRQSFVAHHVSGLRNLSSC